MFCKYVSFQTMSSTAIEFCRKKFGLSSGTLQTNQNVLSAVMDLLTKTQNISRITLTINTLPYHMKYPLA